MNKTELVALRLTELRNLRDALSETKKAIDNMTDATYGPIDLPSWVRETVNEMCAVYTEHYEDTLAAESARREAINLKSWLGMDLEMEEK